MRVVELYSGIGGMHYALQGSSIGRDSQIFFATDLNPVCNEIYKHNFPETNLQCRNINSLTAAELNRLAPDIILMSPPCQPFTRLGKQKDVVDPRNISFLRFIEQILHFKTVSYILIENVKGFETSETRLKLLAALTNSKFKYKEYLLNSLQFGICNSRSRYYLLAKKCSQLPEMNHDINCELPLNYENIIRKMHTDFPTQMSDVLECDPTSAEWEAHLVPMDILKKYCLVMDIVGAESKRSCCFTKGYRRYVEGTGSLIGDIPADEIKFFKQRIKNVSQDDVTCEQLLRKLKLRFLTPTEIAQLMCFPKEFSFPKSVTLMQQYKAVANSINVYVVSFLISYLTNDNFV